MGCCKKSPDAVARIRGGMEAPQLSGCVQFYQESGCVLVVARVCGLPREVKQDSSDSIFIRGIPVPGLIFPEQEIITIRRNRAIQTIRVTCRR